MAKQSSVVVCGGSRLFREGAAALVRAAKFRVLGLHANVEEIRVKGSVKSTDLILMIGDDGASGGFLDMAVKLREANPGCHVVALVGSCSDEERWAAARTGLDGVLLKSVSSEVLCRSLELVLMGEQVFIVNPPTGEPSFETAPFKAAAAEKEPSLPPVPVKDATAAPIAKIPPLPMLNLTTVVSSRREGLSDRELDVLDCLVSGHSNKVIARRCNITEATVKVHLKAILRKISVANRTQAAVWAINKMHMNSSLDYESQGGRGAIGGGNSHSDATAASTGDGERDEDVEDSRPVGSGGRGSLAGHLMGPKESVKAVAAPALR